MRYNDSVADKAVTDTVPRAVNKPTRDACMFDTCDACDDGWLDMWPATYDPVFRVTGSLLFRKQL